MAGKRDDQYLSRLTMFLASVNTFVDAGICWLSFSMCSASIRVSRIPGYGTMYRRYMDASRANCGSGSTPARRRSTRPILPGRYIVRGLVGTACSVSPCSGGRHGQQRRRSPPASPLAWVLTFACLRQLLCLFTALSRVLLLLAGNASVAAFCLSSARL